MEQFQALQDRLYEIHSFPSAIVDNDGNILTATAWQDICTKFHRKNKECEKECILSDQYILSHLDEANPAVSYRCPHGLVDNATPIVVDSAHLGSFFTGQFFLEEPDLEFFRTQANRYGFDEEAYLDAVKKVPIWPQDKLNSYLFFIKGLIEVISGTGLTNLRAIEAKQKSEENEKQFQAMFDTASIGIAQADPHTGRWVRVNQKLCDITGYTDEELLALCVSDVTHPEDRERDWATFQRVVRGEMPNYRIEKCYIRKDGAVIWVNVNMTIIRDATGQSLRTMATIEDISERKQTEENLSKAVQLLMAHIDNSPLAVIEFDAQYRVIRWSKEAERLFGWTLEEVEGRSISEMKWVYSEDEELVLQESAGLLSGERARSLCVNRNYCKDGSVINCEWYNSGIYSGGKLISILSLVLDITERKRVEETLRESKEQLSMALDVGNAGIWQWNLIRNEVSFDARFHTMLGYTPGELPTTMPEWKPYHHPEDAPLLWPKTEAYLHGEFPYFESEHRIRSKKGTWNWIFTRGRIVNSTATGAPERFMGIAINITERKTLEGLLQQAQKMESVGRLAGGVAHDFNNMLGVILGHTEMALKTVDPTLPIHINLEEIRSAAERSADLTRQLLAFARKQTVVPKVLDLNEIVTGMRNMLQRLIGEDIDLAWRPKENLWSVYMDPSQIDQILANLCVNARDAIEGVGKVTIETGNTLFDADYCADHPDFLYGEYVLLAVSDNGCGMDKETLEKLFEPFFTTKAMGKGTGLGLSMVYGIAKQNNGFINVYSEPNHGTVFKIYLPRYMGNDRQMQVEGMRESVLFGHETILLVEDELGILKLTKTILEGRGYTVLMASMPGEAIRLARKHASEIHLLVTDVIMPEMNGRDLAEKLQTLYPHLKCLFMSGYTADVIAHHGVLEEGVHFIQKPFSTQSLAAKVREVLDNKERCPGDTGRV